MFASCELGERSVAVFGKIEDEINQFNWYRFPQKVQHMLPTVMIVVQESAAVEFFGSISCDRECFKKVSICPISMHI